MVANDETFYQVENLHLTVVPGLDHRDEEEEG
jgi:hypothetical protein